MNCKRILTFGMAMASLALLVAAAYAEEVKVWTGKKPTAATFSEDPDGNTDTIWAKDRTRAIESGSARVEDDPVNDGAQLTPHGDSTWVDPNGEDPGYFYTTTSVECRGGIGAVYHISGTHRSGGGEGPVVLETWWAEAKDKSIGTLYLKDNILSYGCSDEYQYSATDKEFYCGSMENGWGDVLLYTETQPQQGYHWYVVLFRGDVQVDAYRCGSAGDRWQYNITAGVLYPAHYSAKLVQAESSQGIPAALEGENIPTIEFAVVHVDVDIDTDNDGVIRTGFNATGVPIDGYNDNTECEAVDDSCEPTGLGLIVPMKFTSTGYIADSERQQVSICLRPADLNRGELEATIPGHNYDQAEGGTEYPSTVITWDLGSQSLSIPTFLYTSLRKEHFTLSTIYGVQINMRLRYQFKYSNANSQYLDATKLDDHARVTIVPPISVAPRYNVAKIWAPLDGADGWEGDSLGPKEVVRQLQSVGWTFEIYTIRPAAAARQAWNADPKINLPESAFKQCSYAAFKGLPDGAGIIIAHGHAGYTACYFTDANDPALPSWQTEGGEPIEGVSISDLDEPIIISGSAYRKLASVSAPWFTAKWKNTNIDNESIVWFMSCLDAAGLDTVVSAAGGRARLGYALKSSGADHMIMAKALFEKLKEAYARTMLVAFREASSRHLLAGLLLRGDAGRQYWTTLHPGVRRMVNTGTAVFPKDSDFSFRQVRKELALGGIIFDTSMRNVTANTCVTGSDILSRSWITQQSGEESFRHAIRFFTTDNCDATVVAENCQNDCPAGATGRELRTTNGYGENATWDW